MIEPYGDGPVYINANGSSRFYINAEYVIFDGLESRQLIFDGTNLNSQQILVYPTQSSNYVTLSRIVARNSNLKVNDGTGVNVGMVGHGMKLYNSEIYSSASVGVYGMCGDNQEIRNNIVYDNYGSGIQYNPHAGTNACPGTDKSDEITIAGNIVYGNGFLRPAQTRPGITLLANENELYDVYVYNNIVYNNKYAGIQVADYSHINARIYNNTVYKNVDRGFYVEDGATVDIRNNIVYDNGGGGSNNWIPSSWGGYRGPDCSTCSNNITTNPGFVSTSLSSNDFLKISASINGYDTNPPVSIDYFGMSRDASSPDIGAHEFGTIEKTATKVPSPVIKKVSIE